MCTYSMVADDFFKRHPTLTPQTPQPDPVFPPIFPSGLRIMPTSPSREEFEALKEEVKELSNLLKAAREFDEKTNQKDCEDAHKVKLLKDLAKELGLENLEF